jgi:hypothetical protein
MSDGGEEEKMMQDAEEMRDYWEYIEEQMALFKEHFPLSTAHDRYNIADKSWDALMAIVVKREMEMDDEEIEVEDGNEEITGEK